MTTDGVKIDTNGEYRIKDGWYIVGQGMCMPVKDEEQADHLLSKYKGERS